MNSANRGRKQAPLAVLLAAVIGLAAAANAEHTHFWRQTTYTEFSKGTPDGVAIRSDGVILPALNFAQFADPNLTYFWVLRLDSKGRLYAAGGSNAKVLRFDAGGKSTSVFESTELAVQDIAVDSQDNLYVATSPDGKIYRVTPDAQKTVFFDPKTKYIWALAVDSRGNLFAGTGDQGKIFVVSPKGDGRIFYQSDERHARALAFDAKGNLIVGTDPDGLVVRIDVRSTAGGLPEAGKAFVLYETGQREIAAVQVDAGGTIYAAASGEKSGVSNTAKQPATNGMTTLPSAVTASSTTSQKLTTTITVTPTSTASISSFFPISSGGSKLFRISSDGVPEQTWDSSDAFIYSLTAAPNGGVLAGTGDDGKILRISGRQEYSDIAKASASQVTALVTSKDGKIYAATANPGKIFTLGPGDAANGSYVSQVFDAKIFSRWGRISWWGENGIAENVKFYARSGNTSDPSDDWSDWAGPYTKPQGESVSCPPARFVQWKVIFSGGASANARPTVSWVDIAYQPRNVAPVIDDIAIQQPGIRAQSAPVQIVTGPLQPVTLQMPRGRGNSGLQLLTSQAIRPEIPPQGYRERGYQTVLWSAYDDNDDDLVYSVYVRREGDTNWTLLKDKLDDKFYSWDTTTMPDGAYYLKIVASDSPSNPPQVALQTERISDRFEVANKQPVIEDLRAVTAPNAVTLQFTARSSGTVLDRAEYSLDAGDWKLLFPEGVLTDSNSETYQHEITSLAEGSHTFAVRVYDRYDNVATTQINFTITVKKH